MFLTLNHRNLEVYRYSRNFVAECYLLAKNLPIEERFALSSQIRRAALSVHLNIAEGASRRSPAERRRFYEIARGSLIEVDTAIGLATDLNLLNGYSTETIGKLIIKCFSLLSGLLKA
ncbi:MAG: four helix bundle protein [Sphingobacteriales bacterium SCN 48-20]|uniref:four helix bundle protein n=1 Tax=Terrimonas ferruginea TaxID=249 RepID=UPI000868905F|nr:four helix bundle protein [Terrimonas ferruginea]MBN8784580.1 four helix bundle protein [Terrimonas ferruginea]ODT93676.1 MAG: four helix bundle protein [Sphingobacteriales bacterium SCN 48-20]OJW39526.1 MAG: four helix bundle protein [Sphingobacteriales bacterium 48-107]